jgi:hypothetical protein
MIDGGDEIVKRAASAQENASFTQPDLGEERD